MSYWKHWPLLLLLAACHTNEPDPVYWEGVISIAGQPAAGMILALYAPPVLPQQLDTLAGDFSVASQAGGYLTLATLLGSQAEHQTETDAEGNYRFDLAQPEEGLLFIYDSLFVHTVIDLAVNPNLSELTLPGGVQLSGTLDATPVLYGGRPLALTGDLNLPPGVELTIPADCWVTVRDDFTFTLAGPITVSGNAAQPVYIVPHPLATDNAADWDFISAQGVNLSHAWCGGWSDGFNFQDASVTISDCGFLRIEHTACSFSNCSDSVWVTDCLFDSSHTALSVTNSYLNLENSIIADSYYGVEFASAQGWVKDNLLLANEEAIACSGGFPSNPTLEGNLFSCNRNDIALKQNDAPSIRSNESRGARMAFLHNRNNGLPLIESNNIIAPDSLLVIHELAANVEGRITAPGNFWHYTDSLQIEEHIIDSLDYPDRLRVDISGFLNAPLELGFQ